MAKNKVNKKMGLVGVELPECPVCLDIMSSPIFQCQSGHSLCNSCSRNLCPPICPICRQAMTQMRNWQLEDLISKATVQCPNKAIGCVFTMVAKDVEQHLKECIFREMPCPLGVTFGRCSWSGKLKEILEHCKERHPANCNISTNNDVYLNNVSITVDDRYMYLVPLGKFLFILSIKIDTCQKMAYWAVQHIGSQKSAQKHTYEIVITSAQNQRRQVTFSDQCFSDGFDINEIFRQGKCGMMPLNMLSHFIKDGKLLFNLNLTCNQNTFKNKDKGNEPAHENKQAPKPQGPKQGNHSRSKSPFVFKSQKGHHGLKVPNQNNNQGGKKHNN